MSEESVISRLAQVIYIIGSIASVFIVVISIEFMIEFFKNWSANNWSIKRLISNSDLKGDWQEVALILFGACATYGLGWSIRFVVTGNTKSVIDRLKR
jgi:hypothetical protein